jgi:hypothetical protein
MTSWFSLHPKSTGLTDEGELGFMKSVEAQFEKIVVAKAKGACEQTANLPVRRAGPSWPQEHRNNRALHAR